MKRIGISVVFILLLVLDWLALDDITTGNEPSLVGEYMVLGVSIVLMPVLYLLWRKI